MLTHSKHTSVNRFDVTSQQEIMRNELKFVAMQLRVNFTVCVEIYMIYNIGYCIYTVYCIYPDMVG